jgi:hypothetical protein
VAWAVVASAAFNATYAYAMVWRSIPTKVSDLLRALLPALVLNSFLFAVLALAHWTLTAYALARPTLYLLGMACTGGIAYATALMFFPIPALRSEADRWKEVMARMFPRRRGTG